MTLDREARVATYGSEQVVEVVGDAAGEKSQALELVGVAHLGFELQALLLEVPQLGHVFDAHGDRGNASPARRDGCGGDAHPAVRVRESVDVILAALGLLAQALSELQRGQTL